MTLTSKIIGLVAALMAGPVLAAAITAPTQTTTVTTSGGGGGGSNYYFSSSSGNDGNACTSSGAPCATIAKLNSISYPSGATINLKAGDTWSAGTTLTLNQSNLTLTSYGGGTCTPLAGQFSGCATLAAAGSQSVGVQINSVSNVTVQNLVVNGNTGSSLINCTVWGSCPAGINYTGNGSTITIQNNEVNGYNYGIAVTGPGGSLSGMTNGVTIQNNLTICPNATSTCNEGIRPRLLTNLLVKSNVAYNQGGSTNPLNGDVGSLFYSEVLNGNITFNVMHDSGAFSGSGDGPWGVEGQNVIIQSNETYHHISQTGISNGDGDGMDLDLCNLDDIAQFNYTHQNGGAGILMWNGGISDCGGAGATYAWGGARTWANNQVRYNISESDGYNFYGAINANSNQASGTNGMYNNTIFAVNTPLQNASGHTGAGACWSNLQGISAYNNACYSAYGNSFITGSGSYAGVDNNAYIRIGTVPGTQWNVYDCSAATLSAWQSCGHDGSGSYSTSNPFSGTPPSNLTCNSTSGPQACGPSTYQTSSGTLLNHGANLTGTFTLGLCPNCAVPSRDYYGNGTGAPYSIGAFQ